MTNIESTSPKHASFLSRLNFLRACLKLLHGHLCRPGDMMRSNRAIAKETVLCEPNSTGAFGVEKMTGEPWELRKWLGIECIRLGHNCQRSILVIKCYSIDFV